MKLISNRYKYDSKSILKLNTLQLKTKKEIEAKINNGQYQLESISCPICASKNDEIIAEKDRYGIRNTTVLCKECGLLRTSPRMDQKSYNDFYLSHFRNLYIGVERTTEQYFNSRKVQGVKIFN